MAVRKYYCSKCYYELNPNEIPVKNIRIKELAVVDFIKSNYFINLFTSTTSMCSSTLLKLASISSFETS